MHCYATGLHFHPTVVIPNHLCGNTRRPMLPLKIKFIFEKVLSLKIWEYCVNVFYKVLLTSKKVGTQNFFDQSLNQLILKEIIQKNLLSLTKAFEYSKIYYRIYSRISRQILDKIWTLNFRFDLYTSQWKWQYHFFNFTQLYSILGLFLDPSAFSTFFHHKCKQDRFTTCFKTCGTGSLFLGVGSGLKVMLFGSILKNVFFCKNFMQISWFFSFLTLKTIKFIILNSVWIAQHPKAGWNIQHLPTLFYFDLYTGFQFWTKFELKYDNSTYTRGDLYASIYGTYKNYPAFYQTHCVVIRPTLHKTLH